MSHSKCLSDQSLRFLLVGKTGSGKKSTANTIFGEDVFHSHSDLTSDTNTCTLHRKECAGTLIEVMDSPDLFDPKKKHEKVAADVVQALACIHSGITAVLYVIMLGTHYTEEDTKVYERLKALLDPRVTQYMIIIFTRGDDLKKKKKTIDEILLQAPDGLQTVLRECDNRYVVFDNMADNTQSQVDQLLEVVQKLSQANGGKPYTCPKYSEIGDKVEEEVARRIQKVEKNVKDTTSGLTLVAETKEVQEKAEKEKIEIKKREQELQQKQMEIEKQRKELESKEQEIRKKDQEIQMKMKQAKEEAEKQRQEFERKKKERDEQMREKDREVKAKLKEVEEKVEKQRKLFEKNEEDRNMQMRNNELEREKQLKSLMESLEKQQLSAERVEQEMKKFRQEAESAREKEQREMEQQRERDRQVLENTQQQMETTHLYEERLEEERVARKVREDHYQSQIQKLLDDIANRENEKQKTEEKIDDREKLYHKELQDLNRRLADAVYRSSCVVL